MVITKCFIKTNKYTCKIVSVRYELFQVHIKHLTQFYIFQIFNSLFVLISETANEKLEKYLDDYM